jgi:hypothetical protein
MSQEEVLALIGVQGSDEEGKRKLEQALKAKKVAFPTLNHSNFMILKKNKKQKGTATFTQWQTLHQAPLIDLMHAANLYQDFDNFDISKIIGERVCYTFPNKCYGVIRGLLFNNYYVVNESGYIPQDLQNKLNAPFFGANQSFIARAQAQHVQKLFRKTNNHRRYVLKRRQIRSHSKVEMCVYVETKTKRIRKHNGEIIQMQQEGHFFSDYELSRPPKEIAQRYPHLLTLRLEKEDEANYPDFTLSGRGYESCFQIGSEVIILENIEEDNGASYPYKGCTGIIRDLIWNQNGTFSGFLQVEVKAPRMQALSIKEQQNMMNEVVYAK